MPRYLSSICSFLFVFASLLYLNFKCIWFSTNISFFGSVFIIFHIFHIFVVKWKVNEGCNLVTSWYVECKIIDKFTRKRFLKSLLKSGKNKSFQMSDYKFCFQILLICNRKILNWHFKKLVLLILGWFGSRQNLIKFLA